MSLHKEDLPDSSQVEVANEKTDRASTSRDGPEAESQHDLEERVTWKAWLSIFFLCFSFGAPFWATPTTAAVSSQLLGQFGQSELSAWVIPSITTVATVFILLFASNSDLFGRRYFLLLSCVVGCIGYILCALATNFKMLLAGLIFNGCASGISGIALIAVPELIPNKYRHIGVVLADGIVYLYIIIGPIVGRYVLIRGGDAWRWIYWVGLIVQALTGVGLGVFYFPPKHPRGVAWRDALRGLDWIGGLLFTIGAPLVLVGIVYTSYVPSSDVRVVSTLVIGVVFIIAFGLWERFSRVRFPLCPNDVFVSHKGREFTVPFCLAFIIVGFYYGSSVLYPSILNAFYIDENTTTSTQIALSLPSGLPLVFGSILLTVFGRKVGHWKWSMTVSAASLCLWGSLLALVKPHNKALMIAFYSLEQLSYGWAAYLSVTYTQLGVPQHMLGVSGGLAGTARYMGGAIASACYSTAMSNGVAKKSAEVIPAAAMAAGVPKNVFDQVVAAASSPTSVLVKIPGVDRDMALAVREAYKQAAAYGIRNTALVSMAFGVVGVVLCLFLEDIEPKMTPKIETFLENDVLAKKNRHH